MLRLVAATIMFVGLASSVCIAEEPAVVPDTPENRAKLTERYFSLVPLEQMIKEMGEELVGMVPPEEHEAFREVWAKMTDGDSFARLERAAKDSFQRHMNTAELSAFIRFMEDPAGRSAMDKMKHYMADIMPLSQQLAMEALAQVGHKEHHGHAHPH